MNDAENAAMKKHGVRSWLKQTNGWQRIWCVLVVLSFLGLLFGMSLGRVEENLDGSQRKYLGSLICTNDENFVACNILAVAAWAIASVGLYALGLAFAWIVRGFRDAGHGGDKEGGE